MKRISFYFRLICRYMRMGALRMAQYPADTIIMFISMVLRECMGLIGILAITMIRGELGGWNIYKILLMFSMCAMTEAISMAFFDGVWSLDSEIREGTMDMYYVRPASIFVQILGAVQHYPALISFFLYFGLMVFAWLQLEISITLIKAVFLIEFFVCGVIINTGIYTIFNCMNFWIVQGEDIAQLVHTCREFAKYPLHIFPRFIEVIFTFMIPFGFIGYYPTIFLCGKEDIKIMVSMLITAILVLVGAWGIWKKGVRSYESTGN